MREFWKFLRTIEWPVQLIGLGTIGLWLLKALVLDQRPGPWPLYDLGRVTEGVFSALISGYVFYVLFALWPEYRDRRVMSGYICTKIQRIVGDSMAICFEVGRNSGVDISRLEDRSGKIEEAFANVNPAIPPNMIYYVGMERRNSTWVQYLRDRFDRSKQNIDELLRHSKFLDAKVIDLCSAIDNCTYFDIAKTASELERLTVPYKNLSNFAGPFEDYAEMCRKLAVWHDAHRPSNASPLLGDQT